MNSFAKRCRARPASQRALSRRHVLQVGAAASALALAGCSASATSPNDGVIANPLPPAQPTAPTSGSGVHPIFGADPMTRQTAALNLRLDAATAQSRMEYGTQETNGDEGRYADYRASYSKALPHDGLGEVDQEAYAQYLRALDTGLPAEFEAIALGGSRKLANPLGADRYELVGLDSHKTFMRPAPEFAGLETAAEMGELYWKALCRDVPFADYETSPLIFDAVNDLNGFSTTVGPKVRDQQTTATVFRGETPGDLEGPYISQLLFKDIPYGNGRIEQRYDVPASDQNYMTDAASWLEIQRGFTPPRLVKGNRRYISDARALGEYVHVDYTYQAYLNAALILLATPNSLDPNNPYLQSRTQGAFTSLGGPDILDLVSKAGNLALSGAWYQKWLVHRRVRPEGYGGRLHFQMTGAKDYGLPTEIMDCEAVARTHDRYGTYFLPQAFPEGSPTHPSYPAGHATIAGACCTILKAFFDEDGLIPDPVVASRDGSELEPYNGALTIGGEINKLANNVALGRDWAGVHYRSDGVDGLIVGEQQALGLLMDYSRSYAEVFEGFSLRKYDGTVVTIKDGVIS